MTLTQLEIFSLVAELRGFTARPIVWGFPNRRCLTP